MTNIVVGDFKTGFQTDRPAFLINNDAFPVMNNGYMWRGRVLKKRGVSQLGQLTRLLTAQSAGNYSTINGTNTLNIFTGLGLNVDEPNAAIVLGNISNITIVFGAPISQSLTNTSGTATLTVVGAGPIVSATINYATGIVTIIGNAAVGPAIVAVTLSYYPRLPVMGIEEFLLLRTSAASPDRINFPLTVFFDTRYSYLFNGLSGPFYDVNYYCGSGSHFLWSGADYQQFWTTNYQGAMWATNNKPGFNKATVSLIATDNGAAFPQTQAIWKFTLSVSNLINGDHLFFNEFATQTALNKLTGTIIDASAAPIYRVQFDSAITITATDTGMVQLLTSSIAGQDGIKYFIGDPIASPPTPDLTKGWVNFAPPLSNSATPSYLVGAKIILPFKNRLLFFGTWTQTSGAANATYNPNQLVSCQNGTVFYADECLPPNQTADPTSFYQNVVGKGLRLNAPISQEIICVSENNDVIIVIFERKPLKLYSTGDDSAPFLYQTVSTEFGAQSTFSAIPLDSGVLSIGPYGYAMTDQNSAKRIDIQIPDQVFNINQNDNGINRVTAVRDFRNEFVYFTFPTNANITTNKDQIKWKFPTTTLAFNYRDFSWSTFTENYTTYGTFRYSEGYKWSQLGAKFGTWANWHNPWNFGATQSKYPFIVCGNQQGFIMMKEDSTFEAASQYIKAITIAGSGLSTIVTITSPNHNLNDGDYILIDGAIGVDNLNGNIFSINASPSNVDTFTLYLTQAQQALPPVFNNPPTNAYLGGATYSRLTEIDIQTKQFPVAWGDSRQTRIGTQKYLFQTTKSGQLTVSLLVNQGNTLVANSEDFSTYLPFSDIVLTCPEGNNLNATQLYQDQIWHRLNTSVIGDTVQVRFTLSDAQMRDSVINSSEIVLYGFILTLYPGPPLGI